MAYFKVVTPIITEPITLAEVKTQLNIYDAGYNDSQVETIPTQVTGPSTVTGAAVDVLGCRATMWVNVGVVAAGGKLDVAIYESDGGAFTAWGVFTQITAAGSVSKLYTGGKRYIRAVAVITVANITFGVNVQTLAGDPVSDAELSALITRAREDAEAITRLAFVPQTLEMGLDEFPDADYINLRLPPLTSISNFDIYDSAGTKIPQTNFLTDADSIPGRLVLPYGATWPTGADYPVNPIRIKYIAGYTTLPARLKNILVLHAAMLKRYKDVPIPKDEYNQLIKLYNANRVFWFGGEQA